MKGDVPKSNGAAQSWNGTGVAGRKGKTTLFVLLTYRGVPLPDPVDVCEADITKTLWRVIHNLADERVFLDCTNHLSDRELYSVLWSRFLRERKARWDSFDVIRIDILEAWSNGDVEIYLKHYAEEESRQNWIKDFHEAIPEHVDPPYDRDRFLPGH